MDYSDEECVTEAIKFLDYAKLFFRNHDIDTALTAYEMIFNIFENSEYYESEYFIYGFSFDEAIEAEFLREHKTNYLRCLYLASSQAQDFKKVYAKLIHEQNIFLSDVIEISRDPLPHLDQFIDGFIEFIGDNAKFDSHLADILFLKGKASVKEFAYKNGHKHPSIFLFYYESIKEESSQSDIAKTILDGIKIIPEQYIIRSYLGLDLIDIASSLNDKESLTIGYGTAFYSNPTLENFGHYANYIVYEIKLPEIEKLRAYLENHHVTQSDSYYSSAQRNIYSTATAVVNNKAVIIGKYLFEKIDTLIKYINPNDFLGFSASKKYVAVILALTLKAIVKGNSATAVNQLLDHYCLNVQSSEYSLLKSLIDDRARNIEMSKQSVANTLKRIESLAVNRVSHILGQKLRGGYDSACLLLVACAEVEQIELNCGNELIRRIDNEFKRFTAFRRSLKSLTASSKILFSVK